jgi:hypothetical protein
VLWVMIPLLLLLNHHNNLDFNLNREGKIFNDWRGNNEENDDEEPKFDWMYDTCENFPFIMSLDDNLKYLKRQ